MGVEAQPDEQDSFVGRVVADRYRVVEALARGGMGRVYRAIQEPLGREVALKVLDIQELRDSTGGEAAGKGFADRFFLEAASVAKLDHPNTVTVHDYGTTDDGACFIAMELLEGRTLGQLIREEAPLAPRRVVRIALQVCASLGEAHGEGLVHRDLKPGNVMLTERGADREFVKVLDFGLVKRENENSELTASGALVGTPKYMAPEQVTGDGVGPWSDVYALGAVMYHMLTGEPVFIGDSKFALLAAHMNVEPDPMAERVPGLEVPPELEAIVRRCLDKVPGARFASMEALAEALIASADVSALPASSLPSSDSLRSLADGGAFGSTGSGERAVVRRPKEPGEPAETGAMGETVSVVDAAPWTTEPQAPQGSRARVLTALAASVVLAFLVGGYLMSRRAPASDPATPAAPAEAAESHPATRAPAPAPTPEPIGAPAEATVAAPTAPSMGPQRVLLTSEPEGAHARRGEFDLGDTPVTLVIPEGETWTIQLSAPGYGSRTVTATAGQGEVRARLPRLRRPVRRPTKRQASEQPPDMAPPVMTTRRTDNRDPWATP